MKMILFGFHSVSRIGFLFTEWLTFIWARYRISRLEVFCKISALNPHMHEIFATFLNENLSSCNFLVTIFTRKMPESSDSLYFFFFMLENIWYHLFTLRGLNSQDIVNFAPIMSPWYKFTISCEFGPLEVKWWCHMMFSSIKM